MEEYEICCHECGALIEDYEPEIFYGEYVCSDCMNFKSIEEEEEHEEWLETQQSKFDQTLKLWYN